MSEGIADLGACLGKIREILGEQLSTNTSVREHHAHDESWHTHCLPEAVCFVTDVEQISQILRICNEHRIAVTPFGTGTGVEGAAIPSPGSISVFCEFRTQTVASRVPVFFICSSRQRSVTSGVSSPPSDSGNETGNELCRTVNSTSNSSR